MLSNLSRIIDFKTTCLLYFYILIPQIYGSRGSGQFFLRAKSMTFEEYFTLREHTSWSSVDLLEIQRNYS